MHLTHKERPIYEVKNRRNNWLPVSEHSASIFKNKGDDARLTADRGRTEVEVEYGARVNFDSSIVTEKGNHK